MPIDSMNRLREDLVRLIEGGGSHITFDDAVKNVTAAELGQAGADVGDGRPHTVWRLVEHLRIAQRDLLDYARGEGYVEKNWPDDYWPDGDAPPGADDAAKLSAFEAACDGFHQDAAAFVAMVRDPNVDPLAPIPQAKNTSLVRNILVAADHNAYHLGQLVELRKSIGTWPG